ncbi:MAG: glycosyltransferase [Planctomycetes bacterium]|nr:glycosyltransferase [Planctomycetota bacterium]
MRVAILSGNAPRQSAVGNQIAEKLRFFQERGAEVRLFLQDARRLHSDLLACTIEVPTPVAEGPAWKYLVHADLVLVVYAQHFSLLPWLPALGGAGPRIVFDYLGVTPTAFGCQQHQEVLRQSERQRDFVWCANSALTTSRANADELHEATGFPTAHTATLPLAVDTDRFYPDLSERFLQRTLSIAGPILLYVGRLAGNKRVPVLIEALAKLQDDSAHAVIIGDQGDIYAEEVARCQALAEHSGVSQRVHWLGQLDDTDLARAYRSATCLVMPSSHEGFCVPVIEAMASGLPVITARSEALPETVGNAGLTFTPDDSDDLVCAIRRVLMTDGLDAALGIVRPRRVAFVCFRFGSQMVGGAEMSLRSMAKSLNGAGHRVEIFTTCTTTESHWKNDLPEGEFALDGLRVHRFPIDGHDASAHGEAFRAILDADGQVCTDIEESYLRHSIHSSALLAALGERAGEFDAIVTGPYLFGLTADIAREFPAKTLIVPCFHDEGLARLAVWPRLYGNCAGILFHSIEEQVFAQTRLGVNHPNTQVVGALLGGPSTWCRRTEPANASSSRPYVVYCGRYSEQKNLPLLLDWARRFQTDHPGQLDFVFMGQGRLALPREPWLRDLGRVDEATKRSVLAGALALVQLSIQESLSLVALEAWATGTPVVAHQDCAVLAGQIARSSGGVVVADYDGFAQALAAVSHDPTYGERGRAYVAEHYDSADRFRSLLLGAIDAVQRPICQQMRERGVQRAGLFSRPAWQQRFAEFVENALTQPARPMCNELVVEPMRATVEAAAGARSLLIPVRLAQRGTVCAIPDGPGRTVICCEIRAVQGALVVKETEIPLACIVTPTQTQVAALALELPGDPGCYDVRLWSEMQGKQLCEPAAFSLVLTGEAVKQTHSPTAVFLDAVRKALPQAHRLQKLPTDYVDVTEGTLAPVKRLIKRKLFHNFKHAYVDVVSRQQTQMNEKLVLMIQQLSECCEMLDHAVVGLHQRLDGLQAKLEETPSDCVTRCERKEHASKP